MADHTTFIKLDRNILNWRWFKNSVTYHIFSLLLLDANYEDHDFGKETIHRGELATSYQSIAESCGLSVSTVRRVLHNLEETGEIKRVVKDHYQIIKVVKYNEYQGCSLRTPKRQPLEHPDEQPVEQPLEHQLKNNKKGKKNKEKKEDFSLRESFPCGADEKPDWMDDERWEKVKYMTVDNIPDKERGFYDSYIEYEEEHKGAAT